MRVDGNSAVPADISSGGSTMTIDDQIIKELSVPVQKGDWRGANARRDAVKEIFEKLPPDQAKELYDRLQNYNWKDNLNDKFHGTFEDYSLNILKNTLKSRFEPQNGGTTSTSGTPQTGNASGAEKKTDVGNVGKTRQDQLNDALEAKGPDAPLKIAQRKDLDEIGKRNAITSAIVNSSPDEFKKMIEQSGSWPKDVQKQFDKIIAEGNFARRITADLKPEQQMQMLKRLHEGGFGDAVTSITASFDSNQLNQVVADLKSSPGMDSSNRATRDLRYVLANRAKELSPENQRKLADSIIKDQTPEPERAQGSRAGNIRDMFHELSDAQSKELFAHIQQNGDLKKMMANFNGDTPVDFKHEFLGLGKKELTAMKEAFEQLAAEQPAGSPLQKIYAANARATLMGM